MGLAAPSWAHSSPGVGWSSARRPSGILARSPGPAELGPDLARAAVGRLHLRLRGGGRPVAERAVQRCSVGLKAARGHAPQARGDTRAAPVRVGSLGASTDCRRTRPGRRPPTDRSVRTSTARSGMAHRGRSRASPTRWLRRQPPGPATEPLQRLRAPQQTPPQRCATASRLRPPTVGLARRSAPPASTPAGPSACRHGAKGMQFPRPCRVVGGSLTRLDLRGSTESSRDGSLRDPKSCHDRRCASVSEFAARAGSRKHAPAPASHADGGYDPESNHCRARPLNAIAPMSPARSLTWPRT